MTQWFDVQSTAVVSDEYGVAPETASFLTAQGIGEAARFTPDRVDDLNENVIEGRVRYVVFETYERALSSIWDGDIAYTEWVKRGVELHFVRPAPIDPAAALGAMDRSWKSWNSHRLRRNAIAGLWFSIVALIVAFLLNVALTFIHR